MNKKFRLLLKKKVRKYLEISKNVAVDLNIMRSDISRISLIITSKFSEIDDSITGEQDLNNTRSLLTFCMKYRSQVVERKIQVNKCINLWSQLESKCNDRLLPCKEIADLKNKDLRTAVINNVIGSLQYKIKETQTMKDALDALLWLINKNQDAIQYQISCWKDEIWATKQS